MENKHKPYGPYEKYIKRPLDFLLRISGGHRFWMALHIRCYLSESEAGIACAVSAEEARERR